MIKIETPRLLLREYVLDDAPSLLKLNNDAKVMRYLTDKNPISLEEAQKIVQTLQNQYVTYGYGRWAVIEKKTGLHLGWCGLKYREDDKIRGIFTDIGYRFEHQYWGVGFATESAKACLSYGFEVLGLQSIIGCADKGNKASRRILEKIGLQFKTDFLLDGRPTDWLEISSDAFLRRQMI